MHDESNFRLRERMREGSGEKRRLGSRETEKEGNRRGGKKEIQSRRD